MDERPEQPPEGKLLAEALERSGLSIRKASLAAGLSYGRWRQITSGFQNVSPGEWARVRGPAATVARMAGVVGVSPSQLEGAGRPDAAAKLRELQEQEAARAEEDDRPDIVRANWDRDAVRRLWEDNAGIDRKTRMEYILFYLAAVETGRARAAAAEAEITDLHKANGA